MNLSAKLERIIDFLKDGKPADTLRYQPEDVAAEMNPLEAALDAGLSAKHLVGGAFRMLPFTGVDGSSEEPDLTCSLTGALEGDTIAALLEISDFGDNRVKFEAVISSAGQIEQVALEDLSAKTYLVLLIKE